MATNVAKDTSTKRKAEHDDGSDEAHSNKIRKRKRSVTHMKATEALSDPENEQAPRYGRRVIYPEGPPINLDDPELLKLLRMNWGDDEVEGFHKGFKKVSRAPRRNQDLKPAKGHWGSEELATADLWRKHLAVRKPKEGRNKKGNALAKEVYDIQPEDVYEIKPGENTVIYDETDNSVAGVVVWNFLDGGSTPGTLGYGIIDHIDKSLCKLGKMLRNSRRDDGGELIQLGYTSARTTKRSSPNSATQNLPEVAGRGDDPLLSDSIQPAEPAQPFEAKMSKTSLPTSVEPEQSLFDWSRSLTSVNHTVGQLRGYVHEATSIQSMLWTAYQKVLPAEIIDDFKDTMASHGLPRMDWNMKGKPVHSNISIKANGKKYEVSGFELGPPSAVVGMNYVKVVHNEHNGNQYVISFTTNRTAAVDEGRNFLFSKYGLKVPNRRNTIIVHRATDAHGTTLPHRSPEEESDKHAKPQQSGTSMLIGQSLLNAWSKYNGETKAQYEAKKADLQKKRVF